MGRILLPAAALAVLLSACAAHDPARLGDQAFRHERYSIAMLYYDEAIRREGARPEVWARYGMSLVAVGRPELAIEPLDRSLRLGLTEKGASQVQQYAGLAYLLQDRPKQALERLSAAVALDPKNYRAWNFRGVALARLNRLSDADASFESALDVVRHYSEASSNRAEAALLRGMRKSDREAWWQEWLLYMKKSFKRR